VLIGAGISLSRVLRDVARGALVMLLFDTVVAIAYVKFGWGWLALPHIPLAIFGGVIGAIVGFRNNSAYARWWEARTLWGQIVNQSRSLARQTLSMVEDCKSCDPSQRIRIQRQIIFLQIAYVHALRCQLRGLPPWEDLERLLDSETVGRFRSCRNVAVCIQKEIASLVAECFNQGWIDNLRWSAMDRTLSELMNAQGGAERIKNTPMPKHYDVFPQLFVSVYCVLLPLGMVQSLELFTPLGSSLVGVIFMALDEIGRDLENPFDNGVHDVALNAITRTIEIDLKQLVGEANLPQPEKVVNGVLW